MAKAIYLGVGGTTKKVKTIYIGVGNTAKKVNKVYVGVGGVAKQVWPSKLEYTYSGSKSFAGDVEGDWELAFTTNGTLKFTSIPTTIDIFLVGGGAKGGAGSAVNQSITGGAGGKGGQCKTVSNVTVADNVNYTITIGGAGGTTSMSGSGFTTVSANGGSGVSGGAGASMPNINYPTQGSNATAGSNGSYAFGSSSTALWSGYRYGAGGGGGGVYRRNNSGNSWSFASASGGTSGGGAGAAASANNTNGSAATANSGSGGGGGNARIYGNTYGNGSGGAGGTGIIIIRNHR